MHVRDIYVTYTQFSYVKSRTEEIDALRKQVTAFLARQRSMNSSEGLPSVVAMTSSWSTVLLPGKIGILPNNSAKIVPADHYNKNEDTNNQVQVIEPYR